MNAKLVKESIDQLHRKKSMADWAKEAFKFWSNKITSPRNLSGSNGFELKYTFNNYYIVKYKLSANEYSAPKLTDNYKESNGYFYEIFNLPFGKVYWYLSNVVGGAIKFNGKGYWSGSAKYFGKDINKNLYDISIGNFVQFAMEESDIKRILEQNFSGLDYTLNDGDIIVNWKGFIDLK